MKEDKLYEHLKRRINKIIIDEQFGVSDELDLKVNEIYGKVIKSLSKKDAEPYDNNENLYIRKDCIEVDFFGKKIKVQTTNYIFQTEEDYKEFIAKNSLMGGFRNFLFPIEVTLVCVGDEYFLSEFRDTLGHELEHAYQYAKTGKTNSKILDMMLRDRLFLNATMYLNSLNNAERNVAKCIYISDPREQSAFLFGMYQDFKSNPLRNPDVIIQNSEATEWLKNAYESYTYVYNHKNDEDVINSLKKYYKREPKSLLSKDYKKNSFPNVNQFLKFVAKSIKDYEWRYARMVYHCKQKFYRGYRPIKAKYLDECKTNIYIMK